MNNKTIQQQFEAYKTGFISNDKTRYISEFDIMLYFTINMIIYIIAIIAITFLLSTTNTIKIPSIIIIFIITYIIYKQTPLYIYNKAPFKQQIKQHYFEENQEQLQRNFKRDFIIMMVIALYFGTNKDTFTFYIILLLLFILITTIKLFYLHKKEANLTSTKAN